MTQVCDENNRIVPVTVVKAGPCVVTQVRTAGQRRLLRRPARLRRDRPAQGEQAAGRPLRQGRRARRAATSSSCAPTTPSTYTLGQEVTAEVFAAGAAGRRHRHDQGQGLRRCHEAARLPRPRRRPRRRSASTARPAPSAAAPPRAASSRACGWPAGWATSAPPRRTSPSTRSTPRSGLLLIKGAVPGPKGGLVLVRTAAKAAGEGR